MSPDRELSFAKLVQARTELNQLTLRHRESVNHFAFNRGFRRVSSDVPQTHGPTLPDIRPLGEGEKLSGVTTSFTCFESLQEVPHRVSGKMEEADQRRLQAFAESALDRPTEWRSEGAARRYCIVRATGPLARFGDLNLDPRRREVLAGLVREVWQVVGDDPDTRGIYEIALPPTSRSEVATAPALAAMSLEDGVTAKTAEAAQEAAPFESAADLAPEYRYPPNAFLTYWALIGLRALRVAVDDDAELQRRAGTAEAWLYGAVGREIALHFDRESGRDPQQLAWAACGVIAARKSSLSERTEGTAELLRAGFRAFFEQQLDDGTWERGRALFHYPEAGNAYCYVFETLAELTAMALDASHPAAAELRTELRPYLGNLLRAKDHLVRTARTLGPPGLYGWSSNHHPHRPSPESWATGTAYRFLQLLRRLVGIEVRSRSLSELRSTKPRESTETLRKRGDTWNAGPGAAGDLLASLFIHPAAALDSPSKPLDPDRTLFDETRARSAILFGPPGTGKTTLAEAVAGALSWDFVEITPADFLDQGMDLVSARADEVFKQLMELDRCVVLLDEIDELIRTRSSSADPLERFFTTTMLPRLARLWKLGRVIFFVNTNSISDVDPAVRRSQRFDAAIFVMPPSLKKKLQMLPEPVRDFVDPRVICKTLSEYDTKPDVVSGEDSRLGWFAFLRYDQMLRLSQIASHDRDHFFDQVARLGRELLSSDWAFTIESATHVATGNDDNLNELQRMVRAYKAGANFQRLDSGRIRVVRFDSEEPVPDGLSDLGVEGYRRWDDAGSDGSQVPLNGAGEFIGG